MPQKNCDETIGRLADLEAIRDLANRYAHCVWQEDAAGAVALFADDGVMDTGDRPPICGRAALLETYQAILPGSGLQPFVHNHVIDLDGNRATGHCYLDLRGTAGGQSMLGSGYYDDVYTRIDGRWCFASRKLTMRFWVPLQQGWAPPADKAKPA